MQGHRDGHGFVLRDDAGPDVYLSSSQMRAVLHQDRVKVEVVRLDRKGRPEGRVLAVLQRAANALVGRLLHEDGRWWVVPDDQRYGQDIAVADADIGAAQAGQVVVVSLTQAPALFMQPVGRVIEVLGQVGDPGMEIEIAVRKFGLPHVFSDACLAQVAALPDKVRAQDRKGRVDLRDVPLVTIDGEDARDFDDAVYCEPTKIGRQKAWRVLVAIADVSHYVGEGHAVDVDAYERATSVYFPRRVIPMLPEKLSNGLCSLNPNVDRLCMVCDMVVTAKGEIHAYQFYQAVMHSHARLTYTEVADVLANPEGETAQKWADRVPQLTHLHAVFQSFLLARHQRGAVDFDTVETYIVCDDKGRIERIEPRVRNDAHRLIEEAMLAANVCSADFIAHHKRLGLFRVHEGPTPEKKEALAKYLQALGVPHSLSDEPTTAQLRDIALSTKSRPDAPSIQTMLLRSMQQALYTPANKGHFGLAYEAYTHFTSPIRRYPDLLVHRVIKAILAERAFHLPPLAPPSPEHLRLLQRLQKRQTAASAKPSAPAARGQGGDAAGTPPVSAAQQQWASVGLHCSANERRADEASRDVQAWLKCQFMQSRVGEVFAGTVSAVTSFGLFITLTELHVEGLMHITDLGADYFRFDEARQQLVGERSGTRYALGSPIEVQVVRVDVDGRRIDFGPAPVPAPASSGASTPASAQASARKRGTPPVGTPSEAAPAPALKGKRRAAEKAELRAALKSLPAGRDRAKAPSTPKSTQRPARSSEPQAPAASGSAPQARTATSTKANSHTQVSAKVTAKAKSTASTKSSTKSSTKAKAKPQPKR